VYQVARALPEVPILGLGGITRGEDALEFLLAGAWAVQVGTANFFDPHALVRVTEEVGRFLARKGLSTVSELRGRLELPERVPQPAHRGG
jgi:dihydroorotate dehydrogenase (NAD+) catalytic subunit